MKNKLAILLLTPMMLSATGCTKNPQPMEPKKIDVILISGQSNAVGCTHTNCITRSIGASKYQEYLKGYPTIQIAFDSWTKDWPDAPYDYSRVVFYSQNKSKDDDFTKVMLGQGNGLTTFGPEIGIAEALHEKYADKLCLIKYACGGSNLRDDWMNRNSPMYPRFIKYVKDQIENLKNKGYIPTIKAFCWMQGEGDSYDGYYQVYTDSLRTFVGNVREDLQDLTGDRELPFIDAGINQDRSVWQYGPEVNAAKRAFAEESESNFYIDTVEAGLHTNVEPFSTPDPMHLDSESQVQLGHLFAEAFEQFLEPVK